MKALVHFATVVLCALALTACGKTSEQKAQDRAKDLVGEQREIAQYLNTAGVPSANWSDADLKTYEQKLNRMEQVESELAAANGSNGVRIIGGNNAALISRLRSKLADAKEEKRNPRRTSDDTSDWGERYRNSGR